MLPGGWAATEGPGDDTFDLSGYEQTPPAEPPPPAIGRDERRMQVRAYNCWADLLSGRKFPTIGDLDPRNHREFGDNGVLLDFSDGIDDPRVCHIGTVLARECGSDAPASIRRISQAPGRSLLARVADYYIQILTTQSPMGFEARFVTRKGQEAMGRGILLPFSSDNSSIDHIYAVLTWKELADADTSGDIEREMQAALRQPRKQAFPDKRERSMLSEPTGRRLRAMTPTSFDTLSRDGREFPLLLARRLETGEVLLLGEIERSDDLVELAAERLLD